MSGHLPGLLFQGDKKAPTMDKLFFTIFRFSMLVLLGYSLCPIILISAKYQDYSYFFFTIRLTALRQTVLLYYDKEAALTHVHTYIFADQ